MFGTAKKSYRIFVTFLKFDIILWVSQKNVNIQKYGPMTTFPSLPFNHSLHPSARNFFTQMGVKTFVRSKLSNYLAQVSQWIPFPPSPSIQRRCPNGSLSFLLQTCDNLPYLPFPFLSFTFLSLPCTYLSRSSFTVCRPGTDERWRFCGVCLFVKFTPLKPTLVLPRRRPLHEIIILRPRSTIGQKKQWGSNGYLIVGGCYQGILGVK